MLLGDSLLAGWSTDLPSTFPTRVIYDFAVGGDRVPNVLWRLEKTDLSHLQPSAAVLLIGTNDLARWHARLRRRGRHRGRLSEDCAPCGPEADVFVLTIPPRGADFHALDAPRQEVNRAIAALAGRFGWVHAVTIDDDTFTCGQYGKPPVAEGTETPRLSCDNYADDNLHFSTKGYVELGRTLRHAAAGVFGEGFLR